MKYYLENYWPKIKKFSSSVKKDSFLFTFFSIHTGPSNFWKKDTISILSCLNAAL